MNDILLTDPLTQPNDPGQKNPLDINNIIRQSHPTLLSCSWLTYVDPPEANPNAQVANFTPGAESQTGGCEYASGAQRSTAQRQRHCAPAHILST